ncbi:hypothetical protein C8R45DRAFT_939629 [Mycena sanguinolenta]|nr:hypothetical protein C8R45DRAFT_939629 [Mycena sanguinolenta]
MLQSIRRWIHEWRPPAAIIDSAQSEEEQKPKPKVFSAADAFQQKCIRTAATHEIREKKKELKGKENNRPSSSSLFRPGRYNDDGDENAKKSSPERFQLMLNVFSFPFPRDGSPRTRGDAVERKGKTESPEREIIARNSRGLKGYDLRQTAVGTSYFARTHYSTLDGKTTGQEIRQRAENGEKSDLRAVRQGGRCGRTSPACEGPLEKDPRWQAELQRR